MAATAAGIHVGRLRGVALVLSAFLVGLAGGVYGQQLGSFNPDVFYLDLTFLTLAMLVVGGINSLSGAVVGALVLSVMSQILRDVESAVGRPGLTEVSFALLTILILPVASHRLARHARRRRPAHHHARGGRAPWSSSGRGAPTPGRSRASACSTGCSTTPSTRSPRSRRRPPSRERIRPGDDDRDRAAAPRGDCSSSRPPRCRRCPADGSRSGWPIGARDGRLRGGRRRPPGPRRAALRPARRAARLGRLAGGAGHGRDLGRSCSSAA